MNLKILLIGGASVSALGSVTYAGIKFMQPKNLKEELAKDNYKPLSTEEGKDKAIWTKLVDAYEKAADLRISTLTFTSSDSQSVDEKIKKLQEECGKLFEKKKDSSDYENSKNLAKAWCVEKSEKVSSSSTTPTTSSGRSTDTRASQGGAGPSSGNTGH